jgi:hypothetical protein
MVRAVMTVWLLLGGVALASPGLTVSAEAESLALGLPSGRLEVARDGNALRGEGLSLHTSAHHLGGTVFGRPVRLSVERGRVQGAVGAESVQLQVARDLNALVVRGTLGAERVDYRASPQRIRGAVGACTWSLTVAGRRYAGWYDCGGPEIPFKADLVLPGWFDRLSDVEQGMLLTIMLSPSAAASAPLSQPTSDLDQILLQRLGLQLASSLSSLPGGLTGVRIDRVVPNSPAARAGLQVGSVLTGIGLEPVRRADDARAALLRLARGASVVLRLARPGEEAWSEVNLVRPP